MAIVGKAVAKEREIKQIMFIKNEIKKIQSYNVTRNKREKNDEQFDSIPKTMSLFGGTNNIFAATIS